MAELTRQQQFPWRCDLQSLPREEAIPRVGRIGMRGCRPSKVPPMPCQGQGLPRVVKAEAAQEVQGLRLATWETIRPLAPQR